MWHTWLTVTGSWILVVRGLISTSYIEEEKKQNRCFSVCASCVVNTNLSLMEQSWHGQWSFSLFLSLDSVLTFRRMRVQAARLPMNISYHWSELKVPVYAQTCWWFANMIWFRLILRRCFFRSNSTRIVSHYEETATNRPTNENGLKWIENFNLF